MVWLEYACTHASRRVSAMISRGDKMPLKDAKPGSTACACIQGGSPFPWRCRDIPHDNGLQSRRKHQKHAGRDAGDEHSAIGSVGNLAGVTIYIATKAIESAQ